MLKLLGVALLSSSFGVCGLQQTERVSHPITRAVVENNNVVLEDNQDFIDNYQVFYDNIQSTVYVPHYDISFNDGVYTYDQMSLVQLITQTGVIEVRCVDSNNSSNSRNFKITDGGLINIATAQPLTGWTTFTILEQDNNLYNALYDAVNVDDDSMPSIADIFNEVTSAITAFVGSLGTAFTQVTSLFYASGNWTFLGVLVLIGVGVGILYGAYRIIKGLLHRV